MSNIEAKSITRLGLSISYEPMDSKWVPLEDAKKLETDLKDSTAQLALDDEVIQGLKKKIAELEQTPTIPISKAIDMIEEVLPNHIVQRSWSLGPQRLCQELNHVVYRLRNMQTTAFKGGN